MLLHLRHFLKESTMILNMRNKNEQKLTITYWSEYQTMVAPKVGPALLWQLQIQMALSKSILID
jgi:hypothetical protein